MIHLGFLRFRVLIIFFIGIFFFLFIVGRALQLQMVPNQRLLELASRQYRAAITLFPKRGVIYDRNMNELAMSRKVGSIFANPKTIRNSKQMAQKLSHLTGISYSKIYSKLKSKKSFVWIDRLVNDSVTAKLTQHPLEGVGIIYEYQRFYNNQELAGQLLGMTGIDSQGIEGLEYGYDAILQGQKKSLALMRDARGRTISVDETQFLEAQEGNSLILSLDKSLQFFIERELENQVHKFQARRGLAIVQNSITGEILSLAQYPYFNPNEFKKYPESVWKNQAVTESVEPGSTFKVFLTALALEEGILPSEQFFCENGHFQVNSKDSIREAQKHKYGWLTLADVLKYSSNIGAAKVALQLGKIPFHRKILEFGFGNKTGIDVPGEASGIIRPFKTWEKIDVSNIAFGQGISVTPIQLISAMSAIANGGKLMRPFVVKKIIESETGEIKETEPQILRQVITQEVSQKLTAILMRVIEEDGTGYLAALDEYAVAGKTGTAQKPNLERGGYYPNKFLASFLGFTPADHKGEKFTILVLIDEPKKYYYASQVAAPLFKSVALHTLRLFPSRWVGGTEEDTVTREGFWSILRDPLAGRAGMVPKGLVPEGSESERERKFLAGKFDSVSRRVDQNPSQMPDLRGKSMREVLEFARQAGLILTVKGSGVAVEQSLKVGSALQAGQKCSVTFKTHSP
ncbi:MAG: hypothetical protein A2Z91_06890 [Deltaproteobacteria bacterium GWA2_38_16]|nr:MAG: hypothetical protein A2Z91_06890 [Deltaproteobacteria bacterium GWA2_38_16]OGQ02403.1 MAG: hypothetical protein A3D19_06135 [Deltaproteobacteria bacterium RIFCSPHIGHO2_02_FULL_38_15]OGQ29959.1 MAG: hypothetical protein A3A72_05975 [Deltaproteobacteria bacterium RIFCSPLOWO2_01_FULL_38_9]OGQ62146.1 MAG: hypothetical protein A3G92_06340 [Deltaproteobacteria bacterium RIFCSPLOWO2_12_FULL_38_8]